MSASWPGNMRGPRVKTPLLLLLLLLTTLTGTVLCQDEDDENTDTATSDADAQPSELLPTTSGTTLLSNTPAIEDAGEETAERDGSGTEPPNSEESSTMDPSVIDLTAAPEVGEENLGFLIIMVLAVLVVIIIGAIVCGIFISRRLHNKNRDQELRKEDPYLDGSNAEKVPMPMFEEDVPSVLELEMEELDQWMKKDSETVDNPNA